MFGLWCSFNQSSNQFPLLSNKHNILNTQHQLETTLLSNSISGVRRPDKEERSKPNLWTSLFVLNKLFRSLLTSSLPFHEIVCWERSTPDVQRGQEVVAPPVYKVIKPSDTDKHQIWPSPPPPAQCLNQPPLRWADSPQTRGQFLTLSLQPRWDFNLPNGNLSANQESNGPP